MRKNRDDITNRIQELKRKALKHQEKEANNTQLYYYYLGQVHAFNDSENIIIQERSLR